MSAEIGAAERAVLEIAEALLEHVGLVETLAARAAWAITFMSISTVTRKARRLPRGILAQFLAEILGGKGEVGLGDRLAADGRDHRIGRRLRRARQRPRRGAAASWAKASEPAQRGARQGPAAASRGQSGCASGARQWSIMMWRLPEAPAPLARGGGLPDFASVDKPKRPLLHVAPRPGDALQGLGPTTTC